MLFRSKLPKDKKRIDPLGQVLLGAGLITEEQLSQALKKHLETGQRLGQTLISMELISSQDVGRMLEKKLKIPYFSLQKWEPLRENLNLFTLEFIHNHRVIPIEIHEGSIKLAMCDPFDLKTIDMIERITNLKPIPFLALEDEFEAFLEQHMSGTETGAEAH